MIEHLENHRMRLIRQVDKSLPAHIDGLHMLAVDICFFSGANDKGTGMCYGLVMSAKVHTPTGIPMLGDGSIINHVHLVGFYLDDAQVDVCVKACCDTLRTKQSTALAGQSPN
jgi:hypothetical protein